MSGKALTPAQIVKKLGQIERLIAGGKPAAAACKRAGITGNMYRRWRKDYGALAKRVNAVEPELKLRSRRLIDSLEQQTATAEILRVIASSPTDTQPVFDLLAQRAGRLCSAEVAVVSRFDGEQIELAAIHGVLPVAVKIVRGLYPMPIGAQTVTARTIRRAKVIHTADVLADQSYGIKEFARAAQFRAGLGVPIVRGRQVIGAIFVGRATPGLFADSQVELLKTFADQAVIAIENVRLFKEIEARNRDLAESLEQQTATSEVLRVISGSPTDVQPVFAAIVASAARLCDATFSAVTQLDGGQLHLVAVNNMSQKETAAYQSIYPRPPARNFVIGRAFVDGRPVQVEDVRTDPDYDPKTLEILQRSAAYRTYLGVPIIRDGVPIGVIGCGRREVKPFTTTQIELVKTFADQAVIAIENVRLFNETRESLEQQTATAEILKVISSSPTNMQPIFDAIVESAVRLCNGIYSAGLLLDQGVIHLVAGHNWVGEGLAVAQRLFPMPVDHDHLTAIAIRESRIIHMENLQSDPAAPASSRELAIATGYQTLLIVPMLREKRAIGAIVVAKAEGPFSEKQIALLQTFADQAVIAIENVRLFKEIEARNRDLTESLNQQTATAEVLKVISSSPTDVQPVFDTIVESVVRLCDGLFSAMFTFDGELIHQVAQHNFTPEAVAEIQRVYPARPSRAHGSARAILDRAVVHIPDVELDAEYAHKDLTRAVGLRSGLFVPMLRDGDPVGVIMVARAEPGPFSDSEIGLLKTFAAQSVIAIENVRLFNETKEALERQTATSEILAVMSGSPTDVQPVFDAIVKSGAQLFRGAAVAVLLADNDHVRLASIADENPNRCARYQAIFPVPLTRDYMNAAAILDHSLVDVPDALDPPGEWSAGVRNFASTGYRAITIMPMMRGDTAVGTVNVVRMAPGPLTDKQIELLKTFADQAVIAIENVRLFNETKEALNQQTATSEVLKVISRSTFDLQPVLETLIENAATLCAADCGFLYRFDGNLQRIVVAYNISPEFAEFILRNPVAPGRGSAVGRAAIEGRAVHIHDVLTDPEYAYPGVGLGGYRTILGVPMLREGVPVGVFSVARNRVLPFTDKQVELVTTFADQAGIAIENVRLFNEIQDKSRQLQVASQHKSEFLANMSHELRTPLNAVIGFSEVLQQRMFGELTDKQGEYIDDIHASGKHLLSLINDILDLSKVEAGRMELDVSAFSVPMAIDNALTLIKERAGRHGIALECTIDPALGEIHADERKMKQILLNLLSNAVKFTPDGGRISVAANSIAGGIEISVTDTGIGIAPEDCEAVFDEFRQVGPQSATKAEGTGLGLALARKFVELHGGAIGVTSEVGKGSTFTFSLMNCAPPGATPGM